MFHLDLLEELGVLLGERIRISYWIASGRRIIALTVFAKTKMRETAEIARAAAAMARCQQEGHTADEEEG